MLFNSFDFLIFFICTTIGFFSVNANIRWLPLLVASCVFYMYFVPVYILILFLTIIVDYFAGILIENSIGRRKKISLIVSIVSNVGILAFFKYFNFFIDNINELGVIFESPISLKYLSIVLPIGLSFHTFQAMSYTIEVYRGNIKAERHFGIYSLYVMFYPQLVAGPIERPQNVLPQLRNLKNFNVDLFGTGLKWILLGLFKKVVIADRLSLIVDEVYKDPNQFSGSALFIAAVFFAIQIYCDFSGYSDIAVGTAKTMGIDLMINFRQPYFSKSLSEFWNRWHISLSTWFKDYVFIPINFHYRRLGLNGIAIAVMCTFFLSGFWHGASWTFILWGVVHGIWLVFETYTVRVRNGINRRFPIISVWKVGVLFTFVFISLSDVFFRSTSIQQAIGIYSKIFDINAVGYLDVGKANLHGMPKLYLGQPLWKFLIASTMVPLALLIDWFVQTRQIVKLNYSKFLLRCVFYTVMISILLFFGTYETNQFIYFQF
jgi:alginate O-acetyltransferase complex protein AlgI